MCRFRQQILIACAVAVVVLIIIEFLVLVELTKPSMINMAWRKNIAVFVVICVIVFAIILYQRTATILK